MVDDRIIKTDGDDVSELLNQMGEYIKDPARLVECYYWTGEPGMVECIRAIAAMPTEARTALLTFFTSAVVQSSISATVNDDGSVTLFAPEAAIILKALFKQPDGQVLYRC